MMKSLPTVEQLNLKKYWDVVRRLEPEFYLIRIALKETKVNPLILPRVIRAIKNMYLGTQYGKIQIFMQAGKITLIQGEETDKINEEAVLDKS